MRKGLIAFGVFVVACLMLLGAWQYVKKGIRDSIKAEIKVAGFDSTEKALAPRSDSIGRVIEKQMVPYVVYRDRIVKEYATDTVIQGFVNSCQQLVVSCTERQLIDSARISNLQGEVKALKQVSKKPPPRISAFIIGGMDFIASQPIVQTGGEVRVVGPVSLTAFVEASRRNNQNDVDTKGVVALKFSFR